MPRFVQLSGELAGESWPVQEGAVLGRDATCEVAVAEASVSRRHARLVFSDGEWRLLDLQSRNGVRLAGERVEEGVLRGGEVVELGKLRLRFHLDDGADREAPDPPSQAGDDRTHTIERATDVAPTPPSLAERRGERLAELARERRSGWFGGDLLQRSGPVRWALYLAVLALAGLAGWVGFLLVRAVA